MGSYFCAGLGKVGGDGLIPELSVCGLLDSGNSAVLRLRKAPASSPAIAFISNQLNPALLLGSILVPLPPLSVLPVTTDANGCFEATIPGGLGPQVLSAQFLIQDLGASFGTGFSHAVLLFLQP